MATYQKTSKGHICATIRIKGYKSVSKTHRTKNLAKAWTQEIEDKMRSGVYHNAKDDALATVFFEYSKKIIPLKKTTRFHAGNIKTLNRYLGSYSFKQLRAEHVVEFVTARLKEVSSSTVRKEINTWSNMCRVASALWGYQLLANPVSQAKDILKTAGALRQPPSRARRLADGEEAKLLIALKDSPSTLLIRS